MSTTSNPLRVCHVAYTFYELDNRVMRYVQTLSRRGDEVDVVVLRRAGQPRRQDAGGARFYRIQKRSPTERHAWSYLVKLLWFCVKSSLLIAMLQLRRRYHVVHVHNIPDFLVFAAWLPKLMGARIILDIHDVVPELYAGKFGTGRQSIAFQALAAVERWCCLFADHVIVANHLWHEKLGGRSVPAAKCTTFLNYPDLSVFKPAPETSTASEQRFLILYPGTLNHHQGVDIAIRAFALVKSHMPDAEFHIYGRGPALPELTRLVHEMGIDGSVRFMDSVDLTQIATIMASASVGVVPKRADGFGNEAFSTKILEFMACGVPVIVSRSRIDAYYFDDSLVNFFEPGNPASLAEVLLRAYKHPSRQSPRIHAAREFAGTYSWQRRSAEYRGLVDSLVISSYNRKAAVL